MPPILVQLHFAKGLWENFSNKNQSNNVIMALFSFRAGKSQGCIIKFSKEGRRKEKRLPFDQLKFSVFSFKFLVFSSFFISHRLPIFISVVLYLRLVSPILPRRRKTAPNKRQLPAFINPARSTHWSSDPVQFTTSLPHWKESTL